DIRNVLVIRMACCRQSGVSVRSSLTMPALEYFRRIVLKRTVRERTIRFRDLVSEGAGSGYGKIKTLVSEIDVKTSCEIRVRVTNQRFVEIRNRSIIIAVHENNITRLSAGKYTFTATSIILYLFSGLENPLRLISVEVTNRETFLYAVHLCSSLTQYIFRTVDYTFAVCNFNYIIPIIGPV